MTTNTTVSTETKIVTNLTTRVLGFDIVYELNAPTEDSGNISEDFDKAAKLATCGIGEILGEYAGIVPGIIITTLRDYANIQKMDYLQKLTINGEKCWCIDNGEYITLMTPDEY